jgi:hypothetical protein
MEPSVPARRNMPVIVTIIVTALLALGLAFMWPG